MTVVTAEDGTFSVVNGGALVQAGFATQAAAWRWIDRQEGEVTTPSEKRADYHFRKSAGEQFGGRS